MGFGERLDGAIEAFAPEWGARRKLARAALATWGAERLGSFPDARPGRLDRAATSGSGSADYQLEIGNDRRKLVDRARAADDGNLLAGAILDRSAETVVGEGFRLQAGTEDPDWNDASEALWGDWGERGADSRGLLTWDEALALLYRSALRDGDVALLLRPDGALRLLESDEIASPTGSFTRADMVDGIELDEDGRPIAYNVFAPQRNALWPDRRVAPHERVSASSVVFLAMRRRLNQTRGLSHFNGMFWLLDQVDGTLEAVSVATRMAACLGLVLKRQGGTLGALAIGTDASGATRRKLRLEPGSILPLEPGEDVQQITPTFPGSAMKDHVRELERLCASRFPVTIEMVLGDYTASNFSNTKNSRLEARERAKIHQARLRAVASAIYRWKVFGWIETGKLRSRPDAFRHRWLCPAWPGADRVTELQASQAAIDSGLSTRSREASQSGADWREEILPELAREQADLAAAGVPIVRGTLTRDPQPTGGSGQAPGGGDDEDEDQGDDGDEDGATVGSAEEESR